jgi:hypothetical protein
MGLSLPPPQELKYQQDMGRSLIEDMIACSNLIRSAFRLGRNANCNNVFEDDYDEA